MTSFNHILSEMPLVLFTILAQAVIGLSLVYAPAFIKWLQKLCKFKVFWVSLRNCNDGCFYPFIFSFK